MARKYMQVREAPKAIQLSVRRKRILQSRFLRQTALLVDRALNKPQAPLS